MKNRFLAALTAALVLSIACAIYTRANELETTANTGMTWSLYWQQHPRQEKATRALRVTFWHCGGRPLVKYVIKPSFEAYTAWGVFSEQSGLTRANSATAGLASTATMVMIGAGAARK